MRHSKRLTRITQIMVVVLLLGLLSSGYLPGNTKVAAAPFQQDITWTITSPVEGSTLSGEVQIRGSATHPNFASYGILYAPGPRPTGSSQWVPLVFGVNVQVNNGVLATWNTAELPNGAYTLALAVYEQGNSEPHLHFVNNLTIQNSESTPTPTPTATPEGTAVAETTPIPPGTAVDAPAIQQPPTSTPRPTTTVAPEGGVSTDSGNDTDDSGLDVGSFFSMDKVVEAASLGAQIAFVLYAMGILYVLAKAVIRYYLKQTSEESHSE